MKHSREYMTIVTSHLQSEMKANKQIEADVIKAFKRFRACDFGEISEEDKQINMQYLETRQGRIVAMYETHGGENIYIILEFNAPPYNMDKATAMFVSDY